MDIFSYIDNYGIYSFDEKPFNDVDSTIFSFLSYVDYGFIPANDKVTLSKVGRMHLGLNNEKKRNIIAVKDAIKLLHYLKDTKRYKNCIFSNYIYEANDDVQFSAICIEYKKGYVFVSYEGTDQMISGWKENLLLSYEFPTLSHVKAINYLNRHFTFSSKKIILGGHSKGGNFALVAGMCCNFLVKSKIQKIYNIDGPGLLEKEINSNRFRKIEDRYVHIIPDNSIIGIILNNKNDVVVKSNVKGPLAHDIFYWEVDNYNFKNAKLSTFSDGLHKGILNFLDNHSQVELELVINDLNMLCKRAGVVSILDFKEDNKKIVKLINEAKKLNKVSRTVLYELLNIFIVSIGNSKYNDFKEFVSKFKIDIKNELDGIKLYSK